MYILHFNSSRNECIFRQGRLEIGKMFWTRLTRDSKLKRLLLCRSAFHFESNAMYYVVGCILVTSACCGLAVVLIGI